MLRPSQKVDPGPGLSQGLSQNDEPGPYKKPRLGPLSITTSNLGQLQLPQVDARTTELLDKFESISSIFNHMSTKSLLEVTEAPATGLITMNHKKSGGWWASQWKDF